MSIEFIAALALFAFVSSITPGPNNFMLMASGANFGFQKTIPHMLGVALGFAFMLFLLGNGLYQVLDSSPYVFLFLKLACVSYLGYLALKIANSAPADLQVKQDARPLSFIQAALFQWVNPKGWTMALTAITVYSPTKTTEAVLIMSVVFALVNLPSVSAWAALGIQIRRVLSNARRLRIFNASMALLLVGSLVPIVST